MPGLIQDYGGEEIYNIYDSTFNNIKDVKTLKSKTEQALKNNKLDYSKVQLGDIVGIYMPSSNMHEVALKEGTTKNTHIGIVTGFDKDGMPIVEHNIHQSHRKDRADNLSGSLQGKARITTVSRLKESPTVSLLEAPQFETKESRFTLKGIKPNKNMKRFMDSIEGNMDMMQKMFPNADMEEVAKISIGVLKRETNYMTATQSQQKSLKDKTKNKARDLVRAFQGKSDETKSSDLIKFKLSTLSPQERKMLNINTPEDLNTPEVAGRASLYTMAKNYSYFKQLQHQYPELKITDDHIKYLTILSYNQGMNKLEHIGFDKDTGLIRPSELEQIQALSDPKAKIKDISSTNYKYLGKLGEALYRLESGFTPYIASAVKEINNTIVKK